MCGVGRRWSSEHSLSSLSTSNLSSSLFVLQKLHNTVRRCEKYNDYLLRIPHPAHLRVMYWPAVYVKDSGSANWRRSTSAPSDSIRNRRSGLWRPFALAMSAPILVTPCNAIKQLHTFYFTFSDNYHGHILSIRSKLKLSITRRDNSRCIFAGSTKCSS